MGRRSLTPTKFPEQETPQFIEPPHSPVNYQYHTSDTNQLWSYLWFALLLLFLWNLQNGKPGDTKDSTP